MRDPFCDVINYCLKLQYGNRSVRMIK